MKLLMLLLCVAAASAKRFGKCEWARVLKDSGMDGYEGVSLADCEYQQCRRDDDFLCLSLT